MPPTARRWRGARSGLREPYELRDGDGVVRMAEIAAYGETVHTFVERADYAGTFLPGFAAVARAGDPSQPGLLAGIDHVVANVELGAMDRWVKFYEDVFGMTELIHFSDEAISTEYSALMSKVVTNGDGRVKFPINEPAEGVRKSQIDEYLEFYGGPGVQHIAVSTTDIVGCVEALAARGVSFLRTPESYYEGVPERVGSIDESLEDLRRLGILVDRDDEGYLLQIFTQPLGDRPTIFLEIIERHGARGFGEGNFKALFRGDRARAGAEGEPLSCATSRWDPCRPSAIRRCATRPATAACSSRRSWATRASRATSRSSITCSRRVTWREVGSFEPLALEEWVPDAHVHRLTQTAGLAPAGDFVSGRRVLMFNDDVEMAICRPAEERDGFYRNGEGDEVIFVHEGSGVFETIFGDVPYRPHDYVVIPRGTTYRVRMDDGVAQTWLTFHTPGEIETPNRYRNRYGQLLEHAPFSQRDFHPPVALRDAPLSGARLSSWCARGAGSSTSSWTTTRSTSSAGTATSIPTASTSTTSSRSPGGCISRRRSTRPSRGRTSSSARSARASSTGTRSRCRSPTTTPTCSPRRSSTTSTASSARAPGSARAR